MRIMLVFKSRMSLPFLSHMSMLHNIHTYQSSILKRLPVLLFVFGKEGFISLTKNLPHTGTQEIFEFSLVVFKTSTVIRRGMHNSRVGQLFCYNTVKLRSFPPSLQSCSQSLAHQFPTVPSYFRTKACYVDLNNGRSQKSSLHHMVMILLGAGMIGNYVNSC
jgi:hypothetical protein